VYALLYLGAPLWERLPMPHAQSAPRVRPELSPARACHRDDVGLSAVEGGWLYLPRALARTDSLTRATLVRSFVRSFLKKVFTTTNAGMDVDAVKRKATARGGAVYDEHQHNNNIKRTNSGVR